MKSLEFELHCPVCKDITKQPIVLPCQHSVCLMCASEVLVASGYPPPELPAEPNSPASTPNTRSPRQARRPTPKAEQRPIERVLRAGLECHSISLNVSKMFSKWSPGQAMKYLCDIISFPGSYLVFFFLDWRSPSTFTLHAPVSRTWDVSGATA